MAQNGEPTTVPPAPFEVLSDGNLRVEITTTVNDNSQEEPYDIQIQGSDRKYPAIILRRRHRGKGATIRTISRHDNSGKLNPLYDDYAEAIRTYLDNRENRLRKGTVVRASPESSVVEARERWVDKTVRGVVEGGQQLD